MFQSLYTKSNDIVDEFIPLKKLSRKEVRFKAKPWITSGLKTSIYKKNNLRKNYLKRRNENALWKCKAYRNKLVSLLKISKENYYKSYFKNSLHNSKATWKRIRELISLKRKNSFFPAKIIKGNNTITNVKTIANEFNNFFANIGRNLANSIKVTDISYKDFLENPQSSSLFLSPTSALEISKIIASLDPCKAMGPYRNKNSKKFYLKILNNLISIPLEILYNFLFSSGTVPDQFKVAKVIPVYKKNSALSVSNYRPISLLSVFNKILEKLTYKRVVSYLDKLSIITDNQFGFRSKHSASHALILLTENIRKSIDQGPFTCGKAFDTVDHSILLDKLSNYGIRGKAHDWFSSYLSNRRQFVSIGSSNSDPLPVRCGVPQGSVLGPPSISNLC